MDISKNDVYIEKHLIDGYSIKSLKIAFCYLTMFNQRNNNMSKFTLRTFILSALTSSTLLITPAFAADSTEITTPMQQTILYVNINTDSVETLADLLSGIGEKKAQAIIDYRELNGFFKTADELLNVKGIGAKTLERNREAIKVEVVEVSSL